LAASVVRRTVGDGSDLGLAQAQRVRRVRAAAAVAVSPRDWFRQQCQALAEHARDGKANGSKAGDQRQPGMATHGASQCGNQVAKEGQASVKR
jgi:hypothetical protein